MLTLTVERLKNFANEDCYKRKHFVIWCVLIKFWSSFKMMYLLCILQKQHFVSKIYEDILKQDPFIKKDFEFPWENN